MPIQKSFGIIFWLVVAFLVCRVSLVSAQEYVLEPGDKLSVAFWQQPDLNTEARIDNEGKIDIPIAGRLTAAGLTISQLSAKIVEKVNIYNRNITQVNLNVLEYGSKRLFITGAVTLPGPRTFEKMPNVWEAILEAGGPLESAQLDNVTIVRGGETHGQTITVDLTAYFDQGDLTKLPELRPGDNIHVPGGTAPGTTAAGATGGGGAAPASGSGLFSRKKVVYIYGQIVSPGSYHLEKDMDVLQAVILAGGPSYITRTAGTGPTSEPDLQHVKIISRGLGNVPVVYEVDLENYAKEAVPQPLMLRPGDTVYVPMKQTYTKFVVSTSLGAAITGSVSIMVSYILLNKLLR